MLHTSTLDEIRLHNTWLTLGVFDGVHLGHQALLRRLVDGAHAVDSPAVVITFHPHPAVVLAGRSDFKLLTTPEDRLSLFDGLGLDAVITLEFTREFAGQTAGKFMRQLRQKLDLSHLLIGYDTALGRGREGDAARLTYLGQELGFRVEVAPEVHAKRTVISSSRIRSLLLELGDVSQAASMLGRPYELCGEVVHGDGRGRHINLPTANLDTPVEKLIPKFGIYAAWAWVGGKRFPAATNIGINPTFTPQKQSPSVEAHLLDYQDDLYGQVVRLDFIARLRDEMVFPDVDALLAQIQIDIRQTRDLLHSG
jgi:riboflavin kinase/FMN adenylyltransferase